MSDFVIEYTMKGSGGDIHLESNHESAFREVLRWIGELECLTLAVKEEGKLRAVMELFPKDGRILDFIHLCNLRPGIAHALYHAANHDYLAICNAMGRYYWLTEMASPTVAIGAYITAVGRGFDGSVVMIKGEQPC